MANAVLASSKVAILVPIYNRKQLGQRCLESILRQTYPFFNVICIDDGSTDGTQDMLLDFAEKDQRVIVISQSNRGVAVARNTGLSFIEQYPQIEWIAWVDSDDCISDDFVETMMATADQAQSDIVMCKCSYEFDTFRSRPELAEPLTIRTVHSTEQLELLCKRASLFPLWGKIFRSALFSSLRFDSRLIIGEDWAVCPDLLSGQRRIASITNYLGYYVQTGDAYDHLMSRKSDATWLLSMCEADLQFHEKLPFPHGHRAVVDDSSHISAHLLVLFGRLAASKDKPYASWLSSIKTREKRLSIFSQARPRSAQEKTALFLYRFARPLFYLRFAIRRKFPERSSR